MKLNHFVFVISLFSPCIINTSTANSKLVSFVQDFLDVKRNQDRPFSSFAQEFLALLRPIENSKDLYKEFDNLLKINSKNPVLYGLVIIKYKKIFPPELVKRVEAIGVTKLIEIFKYRLSVKSRQMIRVSRVYCRLNVPTAVMR